jgi:hypothetical protein
VTNGNCVGDSQTLVLGWKQNDVDRDMVFRFNRTGSEYQLVSLSTHYQMGKCRIKVKVFKIITFTIRILRKCHHAGTLELH